MVFDQKERVDTGLATVFRRVTPGQSYSFRRSDTRRRRAHRESSSLRQGGVPRSFVSRIGSPERAVPDRHRPHSSLRLESPERFHRPTGRRLVHFSDFLRGHAAVVANEGRNRAWFVPVQARCDRLDGGPIGFERPETLSLGSVAGTVGPAETRLRPGHWRGPRRTSRRRGRLRRRVLSARLAERCPAVRR